MAIKIYFGVPGSGKTTLAAKIVSDNLKKGILTYSNVEIRGSVYFDSSQIGTVDISDCDMIVDEAGIEFNSRAYKTLPKHQIQWFKLCRHYGIRNLHIFSQSYMDMDVTLRRLASEIYVVKRTLIPRVFMIKRIQIRIGIDDTTHQIIDQYYFQKFGFKFYSGRKYWHMFDSWTAPALPDPVDPWTLRGFSDYDFDKRSLRAVSRQLKKESMLFYRLLHRIKQNKKSSAISAESYSTDSDEEGSA